MTRTESETFRLRDSVSSPNICCATVPLINTVIVIMVIRPLDLQLLIRGSGESCTIIHGPTPQLASGFSNAMYVDIFAYLHPFS